MLPELLDLRLVPRGDLNLIGRPTPVLFREEGLLDTRFWGELVLRLVSGKVRHW